VFALRYQPRFMRKKTSVRTSSSYASVKVYRCCKGDFDASCVDKPASQSMDFELTYCDPRGHRALTWEMAIKVSLKD